MFEYDFLNMYNGTRQTTGTVEQDRTTIYFMRSLYDRILSEIQFTIPPEWDYNYFTTCLFKLGFVGIIPTVKYGTIPQMSTLTGYGLYLQPTKLLVSQPLVNYEGRIYKDCGLIRLAHDYSGIWDIVEHYALQLSTAYTSLMMSLKNSRVSLVMAAKNKAASDTLKYLAEKISAGESTIIYDKRLKEDDATEADSLFSLVMNPKESYITTDLLNDINSILASFDREIGIPSVDQKRERFIESEIQTLTADSDSRVETWRIFLDESIRKTKEVFPDLQISYTTSKDRRTTDERTLDADRTL